MGRGMWVQDQQYALKQENISIHWFLCLLETTLNPQLCQGLFCQNVLAQAFQRPHEIHSNVVDMILSVYYLRSKHLDITILTKVYMSLSIQNCHGGAPHELCVPLDLYLLNDRGGVMIKVTSKATSISGWDQNEKSKQWNESLYFDKF